MSALPRTPDAAGLVYWVGQARGTWTLTKMSDSFANSAEFKGELLPLCRSGIEVLFIDLCEVTFCDSSGLIGFIYNWLLFFFLQF